MNVLMTDFSNVFDFHFINPLFMRTIYDEQNEIIKKLDEIKKQQEEEISRIKKENEKLRSMIVEKDVIVNLIHDEMTRYFHYRLFQFDGNNEYSFTGIPRYLTRIWNGNIEEKGFIKITSSSIQKNHYQIKTIADFDDKSHYFATANERNSWIKFDFKSHSIRPTFYSLRFRHDFKYQNLQKWVLEGSNTDGNEWKILDSRNNVKRLDGLSFTKYF